MDPNQSSDSSRKWGKLMLIASWVIGLLLLTLFFSDALEQQYNPNQSVQSFTAGDGTQVKLKRNRMGHYVANGYINGHPVTFMLDTGATNVSIPAHLNRTLQLPLGRSFVAQTANGNVRVTGTRINRLQLGDIQLMDVSASLNPGMSNDEILLGMSALKQLDFSQSGDWLILKQ